MSDASPPLWAPWRMDYVTGPKSDRCPFCAAVATDGEQPPAAVDLVVDRMPSTYTILNAYPYASGHVMVAPKRHIADPTELDGQESREIFALTNRALLAMRALMSPDGFNIGLNVGSTAGAGIAAHLHLHIVPRWSGDNNFMPVIAGNRVVPQALSETAVALRSAFAALPAGC